MEKYIQTAKMQLIFRTGDNEYPYLLEITEFVKNCDNPNNYNGQRQFRLLDENFIATGDGFSFSCLSKYYPNCELLVKVTPDYLSYAEQARHREKSGFGM